MGKGRSRVFPKGSGDRTFAPCCRGNGCYLAATFLTTESRMRPGGRARNMLATVCLSLSRPRLCLDLFVSSGAACVANSFFLCSAEAGNRAGKAVRWEMFSTHHRRHNFFLQGRPQCFPMSYLACTRMGQEEKPTKSGRDSMAVGPSARNVPHLWGVSLPRAFASLLCLLSCVVTCDSLGLCCFSARCRAVSHCVLLGVCRPWGGGCGNGVSMLSNPVCVPLPSCLYSI